MEVPRVQVRSAVFPPGMLKQRTCVVWLTEDVTVAALTAGIYGGVSET